MKEIVILFDNPVPGNTSVFNSFLSIRGFGKRFSLSLIKYYGLGLRQKIGNIPENTISEINSLEFLGDFPPWFKNCAKSYSSNEPKHFVGVDLSSNVSLNVSRLKVIGCYRGKRHSAGYKTRGQRTSSNGRSLKPKVI